MVHPHSPPAQELKPRAVEFRAHNQSTMAKGKLTPKQERFIAAYLVNPNATQAAIEAGYSKKTAHVIGQENLTKPAIASVIKAKQQKLADKYEVTAERVIRELALIGFANMMDYMTVEGSDARVDFSKLDRDQAAAIQEITVETVGVSTEDKPAIVRTKFKLASKQGALELLGKHLSLFDSAGDEALKEGLAALLQEGRKRATQAEAQSVH